jgi:Fic family protein
MAEFGTELNQRLVAVEANPYEGEERFAIQVELAVWGHVEFLRIHPFIDGNGRTARVLLNVMLRRFDLYPIQVRDKKSYLKALRRALAGRPEGFIDMLVGLIAEEAERLERAIERQTRRAREHRPKGKKH